MANIGKVLSTASAIAIASMAFSTTSRAADEPPKFGYSITVTALTDYLFRGISLTNNKPELNPYIELTYGIGYLGFWISNVGDATQPDFASLGPIEVDYYAGIRPSFLDINWDFGALGYTFNSRLPGVALGDVSYVEFQAKASKEVVKSLTLGVSGFITPDQGPNYPFTFTVEGAAAYALPKIGIFNPTLSGLIGFTRFENNGTFNTDVNPENPNIVPVSPFVGARDYYYWNAGIKLNVDRWFMDFRYADTDIRSDFVGATTGRRAEAFADSRFLFSAGFTFSGP